ncbi:hypothetical protein ACFQE8_00710 [Salinirubellus sp. GCM10025818]|jgi:hypothetical protein
MSASDLRDRFDHPSFTAAASTAVSYGAILLVMFAVLFVLPFLVFLLLG